MSDTRTINEGTFRITLAGDFVAPPSLVRRIREMVFTARRDIDRVVAIAGTDRAFDSAYKACVEAYFRFDTGHGFGYLDRVTQLRNNLRDLRAGLHSHELTIHAAVGQHAGMEDAAAYVQRNDYAGMLREAVFGANPGVRAGFHGDIYMNLNQLGANNVAAANLVHECAHRFLRARDWAYLPGGYDIIAWLQTWTDLGMAPQYPPRSRNALKAWNTMTWEEALNNADSYGGFVSRYRSPL